VQRRKGQRRLARATIEQARDTFAEHGATLWAKRARGEQRGLGGRPTTGDELTPAETRVAELAASRLTNREVAAALFISTKTVEASLARIYRKLDIYTRAELGAQASTETGSRRELCRETPDDAALTPAYRYRPSRQAREARQRDLVEHFHPRHVTLRRWANEAPLPLKPIGHGAGSLRRTERVIRGTVKHEGETK
jgi:DNA-binding CsgD family transcriptional regulator